jgi:CHASE3 domain sensor protein
MSIGQSASIRKKLYVAFGLVLLLMLLVVVIGSKALTDMHAAQNEMYTHHFKRSLVLMDMQATLLTQAEVLGLLLSADPAMHSEAVKRVRASTEEVEGALQELQDDQVEDADFDRSLETLLSYFRDYVQTRDQELELIQAGRQDEARQLGTGRQEQLFEQMASLADGMVGTATEVVEERLLQTETSLNRSIFLFAAASILAIVAGLL